MTVDGLTNRNAAQAAAPPKGAAGLLHAGSRSVDRAVPRPLTSGQLRTRTLQRRAEAAPRRLPIGRPGRECQKARQLDMRRKEHARWRCRYSPTGTGGAPLVFQNGQKDQVHPNMTRRKGRTFALSGSPFAVAPAAPVPSSCEKARVHPNMTRKRRTLALPGSPSGAGPAARCRLAAVRRQGCNRK
jgi:hypothetical protein